MGLEIVDSTHGIRTRRHEIDGCISIPIIDSSVPHHLQSPVLAEHGIHFSRPSILKEQIRGENSVPGHDSQMEFLFKRGDQQPTILHADESNRNLAIVEWKISGRTRLVGRHRHGECVSCLVRQDTITREGHSEVDRA